MRPCHPLLGLMLLASAVEAAPAGIIEIPSDIGVTLAASPTTNLRPSQPIDMTLSVTNFGPNTEPLVVVSSTVFVDEMSVVSTNFDECLLQLIVGDLSNGGYDYRINWDVADPDSPPIAAGETRTCHFQIALSQHAPSPYTFGFNLFYVFDPNPRNDSASVVLERAVEAPASVPALSNAMLGLLAALCAGVARLADSTRGDARIVSDVSWNGA